MRYAYEVYSNYNANNIYDFFDGRGAKQKAIKYAKEHREYITWVDRVEYDNNGDPTGEYETVWSCDEEEGWDDHLDEMEAKYGVCQQK